MKRSEILNIIKKTIDSGNTWADIDTRAENLLCHLEEAGMKPPSYLKKDPGHFKGDQFKYDINEWEEE